MYIQFVIKIMLKEECHKTKQEIWTKKGILFVFITNRPYIGDYYGFLFVLSWLLLLFLYSNHIFNVPVICQNVRFIS